MAKPLCVEETDSDRDSDSSERASKEEEEEVSVIKVHHQPTTKPGYNPNKYVHVSRILYALYACTAIKQIQTAF